MCCKFLFGNFLFCTHCSNVQRNSSLITSNFQPAFATGNGHKLCHRKRGNMLPESFAVDTCFLDVSQFCHTGNIVSASKTCFCHEAETYVAAENNVFCGTKQGGNIKETYVRRKCYWQHVFSFSESFTVFLRIWKIRHYGSLFLHRLAIKQNHANSVGHRERQF